MAHYLTQEAFHQYWASHLCDTFLPKTSEQEVWARYKTRSLTFVRNAWWYLYGSVPEDLDIQDRRLNKEVLDYMSQMQTPEKWDDRNEVLVDWFTNELCLWFRHHNLAYKDYGDRQWFIDHYYPIAGESLDEVLSELVASHSILDI